MHQKHTSLSFELVYVSPTAASSLSARFLFVTVPPPRVSARLKAHLMHHKKTEEDERVGEAREGGREVEGEAYTSDTLLMKPLTAKQRRKQQERKKFP